MFEGAKRKHVSHAHDFVSPQIRVRHGALDDICESPPPARGGPRRRLRRCNWVRFLAVAGRRQQNRNLRCLRTPSGQLVFEAERAVAPGEELVAGFSQEEEDKEAEQDASSILANALMLRAITSLVTGKQEHCIFIFCRVLCAWEIDHYRHFIR